MSANGRILLGESLGLSEPLSAALSKADAGNPDVVGFGDGGLLVAAFVRMLHAGQPPELVVLDRALPKIEGRSVALALRSIERGMAMTPVAILFYTAETADDALKALLGSLGRAVHLQRPAELPVKEQGKRLAVAIERLMTQLRGSR